MVRANDSTHRRPPAFTQPPPPVSLPSRRGLGDDDRAAGRRHADYEYGLHLNQLDLVTAFAGDRPDGRLATAPSPGATRLSILTSSKRSPLPCRSRRGATVASARSASAAQAGCGFWTTTRWRRRQALAAQYHLRMRKWAVFRSLVHSTSMAKESVLLHC